MVAKTKGTYELSELGLETNVNTTFRSHTVRTLFQNAWHDVTPRVSPAKVQRQLQDEPSLTCHKTSGITFPTIILVHLSFQFFFFGLASQVQRIVLFLKLIRSTVSIALIEESLQSCAWSTNLPIELTHQSIECNRYVFVDIP